ncbi:MAG TPA: carotenoid oxygenase family protein [Allocoleopsis sp.]
MITTAQPTQTQAAWAKAIPPTNSNAIAQPIQEFGLTPLSVISGAIPTGLRGSLYRNGPARLERGGYEAQHWFDGDGAILGVHFTDGGATGTYRFVQTAGYQAEAQAGRLIYSGYGLLPPGSFWERFTKGVKNAANTSVLALPDKLLALWEGGHPHALNLESLETLGIDNLNQLHNGLTYSAHPKRDPQTGDIFNFGVSYGKTGQLHVYRSDQTGQIRQQNAIALDSLPLIHDFVLAGPYLIFCLPAVRLNPLPLLLRLQSYSEALTWQPQLGTQILVLDRDTLNIISRGEAEPWFQWHFGNGFVETDGSISLDIVRYPDFQTNQHLKEVATGQTHTAAKATLWQLRLNPHTGKVLSLSELFDRGCEFPVVNPQDVGQASRFTYLSVHRPDIDTRHELFGAIARFDHQTGQLMTADLGTNCYPTEPIYAPDRHDPNQGWILTVVFDGHQDRSEVQIFASDRLDDAPVCRLALPSIIPLGFHGTWRPT